MLDIFRGTQIQVQVHFIVINIFFSDDNQVTNFKHKGTFFEGKKIIIQTLVSGFGLCHSKILLMEVFFRWEFFSLQRKQDSPLIVR